MVTEGLQQRSLRDEQFGLVTHAPVRPRVRRSGPVRVGHGVRRPVREPLGLVVWMLFLLFYILGARVIIPFFMTTTTIAATRGIPIDVSRSIDRSGADALRAGEVVTTVAGERVDPEDVAVFFLPTDVRDFAARAKGLCWWGGDPGRRVVVVEPALECTYQDMVDAADTVLEVRRAGSSCSFVWVLGGVA